MSAAIELKESANKPMPYVIDIFTGVVICLLYPDLMNVFFNSK